MSVAVQVMILYAQSRSALAVEPCQLRIEEASVRTKASLRPVPFAAVLAGERQAVEPLPARLAGRGTAEVANAFTR